LGFVDDFLIVATSISVKYVRIPPRAFVSCKGMGTKITPYYLPGSPDFEGKVQKGRPVEEVMFKDDVKIL
jgi:hypothetical protein